MKETQDRLVTETGSTRGQRLLEVRDLYLELVSTGTAVPILHDVNIEVFRGERVGIVGESGAGKSMLARTLMRLLPPAVGKLTGAINYDGKNLLELSENDMRTHRGQELAMVFQDPMTFLNPTRTIGSQVAEAVGSRLSRSETTNMVNQVLARVGLDVNSGITRKYPHELSGGMRQRALLTMALVGNPSVLIADEPTTALDVTVQAQVLRLLYDITETHQTALVLITHDLGVVAEVCDWIYVMYQGTVVESADVESLFYAPNHPYTRELLASSD